MRSSEPSACGKITPQPTTIWAQPFTKQAEAKKPSNRSVASACFVKGCGQIVVGCGVIFPQADGSLERINRFPILQSGRNLLQSRPKRRSHRTAPACFEKGCA